MGETAIADALRLSLLTASVATVLAIVLGLPAARLLGLGKRFPGRTLVDTLLSLPLVLPPTVIGYGLLLVLGQGTAFGRFLIERLHIDLLFTWQGASLASAVTAFPLFVRTAAAALSQVDRELLEVGRTLGASETRLFYTVALPLAYRGVLAGATLAFARALGEFGATVMVAGSTPGRTQTLPLLVYDAVQSDDTRTALYGSALILGIAFLLLGVANLWERRLARGQGAL
jgi:molybdate transport system permease protein